MNTEKGNVIDYGLVGYETVLYICSLKELRAGAVGTFGILEHRAQVT